MVKYPGTGISRGATPVRFSTIESALFAADGGREKLRAFPAGPGYQEGYSVPRGSSGGVFSGSVTGLLAAWGRASLWGEKFPDPAFRLLVSVNAVYSRLCFFGLHVKDAWPLAFIAIPGYSNRRGSQ
jgi:hypothetical protein